MNPDRTTQLVGGPYDGRLVHAAVTGIDTVTVNGVLYVGTGQRTKRGFWEAVHQDERLADDSIAIPDRLERA